MQPRRVFLRTERRSQIHASVNLLAVSCECRRTLFPALRMVCPRSEEQENGFRALLLSSAAPGSSLRAEWDSVPRPAGALPQTPPRATAPLDGRNALRGLAYNFVQPRRIAIYFPALRCLRRSWVQGHAPARDVRKNYMRSQ